MRMRKINIKGKIQDKREIYKSYHQHIRRANEVKWQKIDTKIYES